MNDEMLFLTDQQFAKGSRDRVVLIPIGSIEPHGHLPLGIDTFIPDRILRRVHEARDDTILFPTIPLGYNFKYAGWSGSVSLSFDALKLVFSAGIIYLHTLKTEIWK